MHLTGELFSFIIISFIEFTFHKSQHLIKYDDILYLEPSFSMLISSIFDMLNEAYYYIISDIQSSHRHDYFF